MFTTESFIFQSAIIVSISKQSSFTIFFLYAMQKAFEGYAELCVSHRIFNVGLEYNNTGNIVQ